MSRVTYLAFFALVQFVDLVSTSRCDGQVCNSHEVHNEDEEVIMLQLFQDVSRSRRSLKPFGETREGHKIPRQSAASAAQQSHIAEPQQHPHTGRESKVWYMRSPPDIKFVLFVATVLCAATLGFYYLSMKLVVRSSSEDERDFADAVDLSACVVGIMICFCSYGIVQEFITTQLYGGEQFPSVPFLILFNRVCIVVVASASLIATGDTIMWKPTMASALPAAVSLVSSWCQYECLHYVTFPTQVVFKGAKIVPTMIINTIMNRELQPVGDYVRAIIIVGCAIGFSLLVEKGSMQSGDRNTVVGLSLLSTFLLGDAFASNMERRIYVVYQQFTNTQMMFAMGFVGMGYSGVASAFSNGGYSIMFKFIREHPECLTHMLVLSVCSVAGQYLIYYVIKKHGSVTMAVMMTLRQIVSISVSAVLYGHDIPPAAILLTAICFSVVLARPLFRWQAKRTGDPARYVGIPVDALVKKGNQDAPSLHIGLLANSVGKEQLPPSIPTTQGDHMLLHGMQSADFDVKNSLHSYLFKGKPGH